MLLEWPMLIDGPMFMLLLGGGPRLLLGGGPILILGGGPQPPEFDGGGPDDGGGPVPCHAD